MNNLKAIIFDLGGVLLNIDYNKTKAAFIKLGVEDFHTMYSQADADPLFQKLETGHVSETEFYAKMKLHVAEHVTEQMITDAWNAMLLDFRKNSLAELINLRKKYKLFLLSNTNYIHLQAFKKIYRQISDQPFESLFDKVYFSHELGLRKPDLAPFEFVIKENKLIPSQTLFIDDTLKNVVAAEKAGLQVIHFTPGMKVEKLGL